MRWNVIGAVAALCVGCGDSAPPATSGAAEASGDFASSAVNRAPIIESVRIEPAEPAQGAILRAVVMARDPDGQAVVLTHRWFVDAAEQGSGDASFALDQVGKGAQIRVSVIASDGVMVSDAIDASARVIDRSPSLTQVILVPSGEVPPGQTISARAGAMDPDGDQVEYEYTWYVNGERREEQAATFATDGLERGDSIYAEVRATDGSTWTDPQRTAMVTVGSAHPEITSTPPGFREDGEFRYQVVAVDPDGDKRLRYSLEKGPDGMVIDDITGMSVWRPSVATQKGVHPVTVVVRDSGGLETKQSFSITVDEKVETVAVPQGRHRIRDRKPEMPASPEQ